VSRLIFEFEVGAKQIQPFDLRAGLAKRGPSASRNNAPFLFPFVYAHKCGFPESFLFLASPR
jgi:hypothetical protein